MLGWREARASVAAVTRALGLDWRPVVPTAPFVVNGAAVLDASMVCRLPGRRRVCAVAAWAGATNQGVIDDLPGIAAACRAAGVWLHADAGPGGAVLVSPTSRMPRAC